MSNLSYMHGKIIMSSIFDVKTGGTIYYKGIKWRVLSPCNKNGELFEEELIMWIHNSN